MLSGQLSDLNKLSDKLSTSIPCPDDLGFQVSNFQVLTFDTARAVSGQLIDLDKLSVRLNTVNYLQCFDTVGWLAGRASGLKKSERWGAFIVICLGRGADFHTAQLMPLPLTVSCFSKIQSGFTFLVPAHLGSSGKRAVKRVCVCVCVCV